MDTLPLVAFPAMTPERRAELLADTRRAPAPLARCAADVVVEEYALSIAFRRVDEARMELAHADGSLVASVQREQAVIRNRLRSLERLYSAACVEDLQRLPLVGVLDRNR